VAIIFVYNRAQTFSYSTILGMIASGRLSFSSSEELYLFLAFFLAFAIKVPLFPLHTWLPDAHVEAPTAGSVMLASLMLKMGTYGILHFCLPLFPSAARACAPWIAVLAIIGIIYGALVAMAQPNMKKLVAYSSVSHLGFVVLGIFSFTQLGLDGAVYQMLSHGISTGALFVLVGMLYERRHSLEIADYGGVASAAPWLSTAFMIATLASIGLPMLSNFVGEFLVLQGAAIANYTWTIYAALGAILSACYMLWLYQRVFYGEASESVKQRVPDLDVREWVATAPLAALMLWMGVYSQSFLPPVSKTTARVLEQTQVNVRFQVRNEGSPRKSEDPFRAGPKGRPVRERLSRRIVQQPTSALVSETAANVPQDGILRGPEGTLCSPHGYGPCERRINNPPQLNKLPHNLHAPGPNPAEIARAR
jgi:NADH-quinone oxidoreductase subunit M